MILELVVMELELLLPLTNYEYNCIVLGSIQRGRFKA
jgi:hypothetical protein